MSLYLISYDYHKQRDYRRLYALLGSWGAKRLLESLWLASLTGTAAQVRSVLKSVADADDTFAVIELSSSADWAVTAGAYVDGVTWLQTHIGR